MRIGPVVILGILISACNLNQDKFDLIKAENDSLRNKLDSLNQSIAKIESRMILIPRSDTIRLGELYEADLFLASWEKGNPPYSEVYITKNQTDTLIIQDETWNSTLKYHANDTGRYKVRGTLLQDYLGVPQEHIFEAEFFVGDTK